MADIAGRPFLELLLRQLHRHGFKRVILAVGYQKDQIYSHFGNRACGVDLVYSAELEARGTGGALRNAIDWIRSDSLLVMNGDSYTDVNLSKFVAEYRTGNADASMILVPADGRKDCGFVLINENGGVTSFLEKQAHSQPAYTNAGIYLLSLELLSGVPTDIAVSLERDLFPRWLSEDKHINGFVYSGPCLDIGTPDRYRDAQVLLAGVEADRQISRSEHP